MKNYITHQMKAGSYNGFHDLNPGGALYQQQNLGAPATKTDFCICHPWTISHNSCLSLSCCEAELINMKHFTYEKCSQCQLSLVRFSIKSLIITVTALSQICLLGRAIFILNLKQVLYSKFISCLLSRNKWAGDCITTVSCSFNKDCS